MVEVNHALDARPDKCARACAWIQRAEREEEFADDDLRKVPEEFMHLNSNLIRALTMTMPYKHGVRRLLDNELEHQTAKTGQLASAVWVLRKLYRSLATSSSMNDIYNVQSISRVELNSDSYLSDFLHTFTTMADTGRNRAHADIENRVGIGRFSSISFGVSLRKVTQTYSGANGISRGYSPKPFEGQFLFNSEANEACSSSIRPQAGVMLRLKSAEIPITKSPPNTQRRNMGRRPPRRYNIESGYRRAIRYRVTPWIQRRPAKVPDDRVMQELQCGFVARALCLH